MFRYFKYEVIFKLDVQNFSIVQKFKTSQNKIFIMINKEGGRSYPINNFSRLQDTKIGWYSEEITRNDDNERQIDLYSDILPIDLLLSRLGPCPGLVKSQSFKSERKRTRAGAIIIQGVPKKTLQ